MHGNMTLVSVESSQRLSTESNGSAHGYEENTWGHGKNQPKEYRTVSNAH